VFTLTAVDGRNIDLAQTATATEGFQAATANNNTAMRPSPGPLVQQRLPRFVPSA